MQNTLDSSKQSSMAKAIKAFFASPRIKSLLEFLSIVGPIICLVDCVVIPVLLAVLPLFGLKQICHGLSDQILLLIVLVICAPMLTSGFLQHKRKSVIVFMALGFGFMLVANLIGHQVDETLHIVLSVMGSAFLLKANFDNRRFSKHTCGAGHVHFGAQVGGHFDVQEIGHAVHLHDSEQPSQ